MSLSFPTGHKPNPALIVQRPTHGEPRRANPCQCGPRAFIDAQTSECVICGRYPAGTISRTWQRRAQVVAARRAA